MHDSYDPEHGELCQLVQHLDSIQGEMITSDLRDLKIPALLRRQTESQVDPDTGETIAFDTGLFEILVPEAFLDISHEVLDVTHLKQEGDTSTAEILADLETSTRPVPVDTRIEGGPLLRRSEAAGRWLLKAMVCVIAALCFVLIWRSITS